MATLDNSSNSALQITTVLGDDQLFLTSITGQEALNEPYQYDLQLIRENQYGALKQEEILSTLLGSRVSCSIVHDGITRYINGYIEIFSPESRVTDTLGKNSGFYRYRAKIVPWFKFLEQGQNCRIFQKMSIVDILKSVFKSYSFDDYDVASLTGSLATESREFCMQYNETDFAFVTRLLSEIGGFYYCIHDSTGKSLLVLSDDIKTLKPCDLQKDPIVRAGADNDPSNKVFSWQHQYAYVLTSKATVNTYNIEKATNNLKVDETAKTESPIKNVENYRYVGTYTKTDAGKSLAKARVFAEEIKANTVTGEEAYGTFSVGGTVTLGEGFSDETVKKYCVTKISLEFADGYYNDGTLNVPYHCVFECIPAEATSPSPVLSLLPKPMIGGCLHATVAGPKGEEIHTDKYGRIRVKLHFDARSGNDDANSSFWVSTTQSRYGTPRVGEAGLVGFVNGDIDQPYWLSDIATSEMTPLNQSDESKGSATYLGQSPGVNGDPNLYNRIVFEDKQGNQTMTVDAPGDRKTTIEKNDLVVIKTGDLEVTLEEGEVNITTKAKKSIKFKSGGDIILEADGEIKVSAKDDILMEGKNIKQTAQSALVGEANSISSEAKTSNITKAGTTVSMEGASASVKGKTNAALDGGPSTTIKGAMTNIA